MFDKWIEKKIVKIMNAHRNELEIEIKNRIKHFDEEISNCKEQLLEIGTATLKIPIEEYLINSPRFQHAIYEMKQRAMQEWGVPENWLTEPSPCGIYGEVTNTKSFECILKEQTIVLMAGLKTHYTRKDHGKFCIQIADEYKRPIIIGSETQQVIFPMFYLLKSEHLFKIKRLEGLGTLKFSVIGTTITTRSNWNEPEWEIWK